MRVVLWHNAVLYRREDPESVFFSPFFLVRLHHHKQQGANVVHRLAVPKLWVVRGVRGQRVTKGFFAARGIDVRVARKRSVEVLLNVFFGVAPKLLCGLGQQLLVGCSFRFHVFDSLRQKLRVHIRPQVHRDSAAAHIVAFARAVALQPSVPLQLVLRGRLGHARLVLDRSGVQRRMFDQKPEVVMPQFLGTRSVGRGASNVLLQLPILVLRDLVVDFVGVGLGEPDFAAFHRHDELLHRRHGDVAEIQHVLDGGVDFPARVLVVAGRGLAGAGGRGAGIARLRGHRGHGALPELDARPDF